MIIVTSCTFQLPFNRTGVVFDCPFSGLKRFWALVENLTNWLKILSRKRCRELLWVNICNQIVGTMIATSQVEDSFSKGGNMQITELGIERLAYSIEELAALSTLSAPKIRKDIRNGKLTSKKKGSRRIILRDEAVHYLNADDNTDDLEK